MKYKYKFSVIIPIYNVEKYLEETIKSVINQSIGFKKNIQMILINDGSLDNSEEICLKYKEKYPDNIVYEKKENAGVSSARNTGIKYIEGEFVNFLDSDDKWEKNVFKKVYKMFKENEDVNVIGVRQKYFEASKNYTSLDYKFDKDKIVDLKDDYDHIQLSVTSGFFRSSKIKKLEFDSRIKYSEDAKFIYEYMINSNTSKLGIISSSLHLYRKRFAENSAIQTKDTKLDWYRETVKYSYLYLLERAKKVNSSLYKSISYYIMYDYQWRISYDLLKNNFTLEEMNSYYSDTRKLFNMIDDEVIFKQRNLSIIYKQLILNIKYDNLDKMTKLVLSKLELINLNVKTTKEDKKSLVLEGNIDLLYNKKVKLYYKIGNKNTKIETKEDLITKRKNMFNTNMNATYFKVLLPFKDNEKIEFYLEYNNKKIKLNITYGHWAELSNYKKAYYNYDKYTIFNKQNYILIKKKNSIQTIKNEILFNLSLIKHKHLKSLVYRIFHYIFKIFYRKPIWIISDREAYAGDNGEALFKYIINNDNKKHNIYFAIDKKSKDAKKMKKIGKVLHFNTYRYKVMFTISDLIISSHADKYVYNPFGRSYKYIKNLCHFKYVFLQHGVIKHDMSGWLNKFARDFDIFIVTSKEEYDLVTTEKCGYDSSTVKITGLARYDYLSSNNNEEKTIMLAPTWRSSLVGKIIPNTQERKYNPNFKDSPFCKFYNKLFTDKEIIKTLEKYNYKIRFCAHPSLKNQIKDFKLDNKNFVLVKNINYNNEFCNSKLLITDYSSVAYDFAYLKKPIIYNVFDAEEFYKGHIYSVGDYDVEKQGFGEVAKSYDELKKLIIRYIENDCELEKKYLDRINNYFHFHDQNNCKRIYEEILKIED